MKIVKILCLSILLLACNVLNITTPHVCQSTAQCRQAPTSVPTGTIALSPQETPAAVFAAGQGNTPALANIWTVCTKALNIRSGPGPQYEQIGGVYQGETVRTFDQVNGWVRISLIYEQWVDTHYLQKGASTCQSY